MDRNPYIPLAKVRHCESLSARRAWIEIFLLVLVLGIPTSLSARRAWIEMVLGTAIVTILIAVALRKESVDRNRRHEDGSLRLDTSLSARRAWIEILPASRALSL